MPGPSRYQEAMRRARSLESRRTPYEFGHDTLTRLIREGRGPDPAMRRSGSQYFDRVGIGRLLDNRPGADLNFQPFQGNAFRLTDDRLINLDAIPEERPHRLLSSPPPPPPPPPLFFSAFFAFVVQRTGLLLQGSVPSWYPCGPPYP